MTKFAKVKDEKALVRDMDSKAILNIDVQALQDHRRKKQAALMQARRLDGLEQSVNEMKQMLQQLLQNKDKQQ